jgi:hypothetical protein
MSMMVLAIFGAIIVFLMMKSDSGSSNEPVLSGKSYKSKPIMTNNEIEFFNRLVQALPDYYVFLQVSLGALLEGNAQDYKEKNRIRLTFAQKIADYVIYTKNMKPVAIIELDDKTHNQEKDEKRDAMLVQAGYKIIRFNSKKKPSINEIKSIITL